MAMLAITVVDSELRMPLDLAVSSDAYKEILHTYKYGKLTILAILMQDIELDGEESIKVWRTADGRLIVSGDGNEFIAGKDFPGGRVSSNQDSRRKDQFDHLRPAPPRDIQETDI